MAKFEPTRPDYVVRCEDPHTRGRWLTLGAAWKGETQEGVEVISIRLVTMPLGTFDGKLKLLPTQNEEREPPEYKIPA